MKHAVVTLLDWIGLSMVLRLRQHNIGYTADGFYRSDDPTNSVTLLEKFVEGRNIWVTVATAFATAEECVDAMSVRRCDESAPCYRLGEIGVVGRLNVGKVWRDVNCTALYPLHEV